MRVFSFAKGHIISSFPTLNVFLISSAIPAGEVAKLDCPLVDLPHLHHHHRHLNHLHQQHQQHNDHHYPHYQVKLPNWNLRSKIYLIFTSYKLLADGQSCRGFFYPHRQNIFILDIQMQRVPSMSVL